VTHKDARALGVECILVENGISFNAVNEFI
jgi:hypothetical protein